ncbi:MAG: hypothetical protein ACRDNZ_20175, partial [Streptosporangiaceae bacterium]
CRAEAVALRTLKRRMSALGCDAEADSALTGRLIELATLAASLDSRPSLPLGSREAGPASAGPGGRPGWPETRPSWYLLGGAVTVFLAGLGTAAFMAGGSPQAPEPEPHVTPAVDVFVLQHDLLGGAGAGPVGRPAPGLSRGITPSSP